MSSAEIAATKQQRRQSATIDEWGHLPNEPCRFCRKTGGVYFLIDDGPEGKKGLSPSRCDNCGRSWIPGESSA